LWLYRQPFEGALFRSPVYITCDLAFSHSKLTDCICFLQIHQALVIKDGGDFQHILRILGTNVDGRQKVMYAMCSVKGMGRRFSNIVCKKADVDMDKRAGELTQKEMDDLVNVVQNPNEYKIPGWMLNRRKDFKDGKTSQISSNQVALAQTLNYTLSVLPNFYPPKSLHMCMSVHVLFLFFCLHELQGCVCVHTVGSIYATSDQF
jgi:ribosomal protein S13